MTSTKRQHLNNALIVGGCGFLGHHIVTLLQEHHPECDIFVMDLRLSNTLPGVTYLEGDITSRESVDSVLNEVKPEVVIDTVSPVHGLGEAIYYKVNVDGTKVLLEASSDAGVRVFVFTSSASVVFDGASDLINVNESAPIASPAMDPYTETKAIGEKMVLEANRKGGMFTIALRLSGLFGPGDRQIIPGMLGVLARGQTKFQIGDNENLFDFTYIVNAAWAHILATEKLIALSPNTPQTSETPDGEAYFITNGEPCYFWDFPRAIWAIRGHIAPFHIVMPAAIGIAMGGAAELFAWLLNREPGLSRFRVRFSCWNRYFDIRKAKQMLGYQPLVKLHDGLVETLKWFNEQEAMEAAKKGQ
ncbi:3-beta hydroxysteroid dehydrogenase/isomerase family-domain-containing protein [Tuber brumale]|nr:3-beta hydroxysteroid dehydrogenase/isomerase family-domain-containing protein [Tuber brumale]